MYPHINNFGKHFDWRPQTKSLDELWEQFNFNKEGDSANVIDKKEASELNGSIYFVEEGMTKEEFEKKNKDILYNNNCMIYNSNRENLYADRNEAHAAITRREAVISNVVKEMITNGEFDAKKEMVVSKFNYLDEATQLLVLEKLTQQEQNELLSRFDPEKQDLLRVKLDTIKEIDAANEEYKKELIPPDFQ